MEGLKTLFHALLIWGVFAGGFVFTCLVLIFWWPFLLLGGIGWGVYQTIKNW